MMQKTAYSLRGRLLAWLLVATAVIGFVALVDTYREAVRTANSVSDRVLAGSALAIAERVVVAEDGTLLVDIPYVALEMLTSAAQDRVFYRVDGPNGEFITGYKGLPVVARKDEGLATYADGAFRGDPIRLAALERSASTGISSVPFVVTVAETTSARRQLTYTILLRSALRLALMIAGAGFIVWIAVTMSLKPLYQLGDAIAARSPDDLHPIKQAVPKEVEGLVTTVNSFMVRLKSALDAQRNFSGNASHQLRTPMAIVRTQLALATRATTLQEAKIAVRKADIAIAHAERILGQLLLMAKIDATGSNQATTPPLINLSQIARNMTADYVPKADEAGIDLGFEGDEQVLINAEPLLVGEILSNLISNAIAYAGKDTVVTVRTFATNGCSVLEVEDNGVGIAKNKRENVRQRFSRGENNQQSGMGLGLAIVDEIAALFAGTVILTDNQSGKGLKVVVIFNV